jgi:hypothetical protein
MPTVNLKVISAADQLPQRVWIFGTGRGGKILYDHLSKNKIEVAGFVDADEAKPVQSHIPVLKISDFVSNQPTSTPVVLANQYKEVNSVKLVRAGFQELYDGLDFTRKIYAQFNYPDLDSEATIDEMRDAFFRHDCVVVRQLFNPHKLNFFRQICEEIYAEDDARYLEKRNETKKWLREYECGWIWEERLREHTKNVFDYQDITANKKLYDTLNAILGEKWFPIGASQIRRMAAKPEDKPWNSKVGFHLDAQWGVDDQFCINVWTPFTPCGTVAPGLEFLLSSAEHIRHYGCYNPEIPAEPRGRDGINPRIDYAVFESDVLHKNFDESLFWAPTLEPGDVILFSNWAPHRTWIHPAMAATRISLEWRVFIESFDTSKRPKDITS